jgi:hypothetical protein
MGEWVNHAFTHSRIHPLARLPLRPSTTAAVLLLFVALVIRGAAHDPITTKVTWSREVVRIVNKRCLGCHVAGGVAPMPLSTYDQARPWAKAIKDEVVARRMPKWPAARGFGHFSNDPTLSPFEIELVAAWADGGAPKGEERDLPANVPEPASPGSDLGLPFARRLREPAGDVLTQTVPTALKSDRWITGWEFTPNDGAVISAEFTSADGEPIGRWSPPERRVTFPSGAGQRLRAGDSVRVTLNYKSNRQQQDFPVGLPAKAPILGLFLRDKSPTVEVRHVSLGCAGQDADVRLGMTVFGVRIADAAAGVPIGVAMRSRGGRMPEALPLVWVRGFDPAYQPTYQIATPMPPDVGVLAVESLNAGPRCHVVVDYVARRGMK